MKTVQLQSKRIVLAAAGCSLFLHLLLFWGAGRTHLFRIPLFPTPPRPGVTLEFVDSPERIAKADSDPESRLISDRDSRPQDTVPDHDDQESEPRSDGTAPGRSVRKVPRTAQEAKPAEGGQESGRDEQVDSGEGMITARAGEQEGERALSPALQEGLLPLDLDGLDEFLSPEALNPEGKAQVLKQIAYNTRSTAVGRYLSRLKPRVSNLWMLVVMNNTHYVRSRRTSILFKIMPDGNLGQVMLNEHDGPAWEVRYALKAVTGAAPYEKLDQEILDSIKDDGLWLEFTFNYQ